MLTKRFSKLYEQFNQNFRAKKPILCFLSFKRKSENSQFYDTELSGTSVAILKAKEYVKDKLRAKAASIGANAVVGIDFETSIGASSTNIRGSINGTAVIVKKLADINREAEEEKRREEEETLR